MKSLQKCIVLIFLCTLFSLAKEYQLVGEDTSQYHSIRQKKKLFKQLGCDYINQMEVEYSDFSNIDKTKTEHYQSSISTIMNNSTKYKKQIMQWFLAPMYLKWISPLVGYGIFSAKVILQDDFIGVYAGQVRVMRSASDVLAEDVDYAWYYPINAFNGKRLLIDGKFKGNELRFINHSTDPNTKCRDVFINGRFYMIYVAIKDIAKDAELTVSYGDGYWNSRSIDPK